MKNIFTFTTYLLTVLFQYFFFNPSQVEKINNTVIVDSIVTAKLCLVGDLMCHSTQFNYARVDADSFDFTGVFKEVKKYLSASDLTVGNLETVIAGNETGYSGYPYFNAPDDFVYAIKNAGFDLLITANNHALDQGWEGVERTIEVINQNKIHRTGTFVSEEDRDSIRIFMINSIKIAILAYSEHTNGVSIPKGKDFVINLISEGLIKKDILKARSKNVDVVLVHLHFGTEYSREPSDYQKEVVRNIIEAGADIIIGGHLHVIEPTKYFKTNHTKIDSGFVAYSMGNFISNQRWRYSDAGVILNIQISRNIFTDSVFISDVNYLPTWVFKGQTEKRREYIILPLTIDVNDSSYYYLNGNDKKLMMEAFNDTKEIITKYNSKIRLYRQD
jgi:poly-gamma-glutamate capsule biosynthesis protein CapA/YwtB (metallophosphatase superfamily)